MPLLLSSAYATFQPKTQELVISQVVNNTATINLGNLTIGQSGIIVHKFKDNKSIIISTAIVTSTTNDKSIIAIETKNNILKQDAIPTTNLKVQDKDIFVLNHLYSSSLLLVPNLEASQKVQELYKNQNFINPDIFASYLKINNKPIPNKKLIQSFCKEQDIGTIFVLTNNKLSILDINSLKVIYTKDLKILNNEFKSPFFTKVEDFNQNMWDFSDNKIKNFNKYYSKLLGLN